MPMLEDFTDENDQLIFQDERGRFFKIAMCDADAEEGEDEGNYEPDKEESSNISGPLSKKPSLSNDTEELV